MDVIIIVKNILSFIHSMRLNGRNMHSALEKTNHKTKNGPVGI